MSDFLKNNSWKFKEFEESQLIFDKLSYDLTLKLHNFVKSNTSHNSLFTSNQTDDWLNQQCCCSSQLLWSSFFFHLIDENNATQISLKFINNMNNKEITENFKNAILINHNSSLLYLLNKEQIFDIFTKHLSELLENKQDFIFNTRKKLMFKNNFWQLISFGDSPTIKIKH
jgi:hypothetical protein